MTSRTGRKRYRVARASAVVFALTITAASTVLAQNPPPTPPPVQQPPVVTPAQPTPAQQAAQQATGRPVSNEQISNALRQSGMSQQQIQAQLRAAGYDPGLVDPYFSGGGRGGVGAANNDFVQALQTLGILTAPTSTEATESIADRNADRSTARAGGIFGKDIFSRSATVFDPVTAGPVDPAYRLGIGDALQLVVTGQVELAYQLELRRDGTVIVPQVGQISLAGLTLDAARTVLRERMSRSYAGLATGEARLDLSIARIRSNAVFVIGEVESPGSYQVNALATVFHAIARAGGPTDRGSFRDIEVRRANRVVQRLDLYDYLLRGDATGDIRLEQGDVIYIPLNKRVVAFTGQVRRPRVFELRETEGFEDALRFAGGLLASASVERVQIDRILPPERRSPGMERVKVDVEIKGSLDSLARVRLLDGDIVRVFAIGDLRRNTVTISGQVYQPGEYEIRPGMTIGRLIGEAQGLLPWAMSDRVKVVRGLPLTGRSIVFSKDASLPDGRDFLLEEFDVVEVLDSRVGFPAGTIRIEGAVNSPVTRGFIERESLRDAIERSGGLREEAQKIEVYRKRIGPTYSDTTTVQYSFSVGRDFVRDTTFRNFLLERSDHVVVRASPGFREQKFVTVGGFFTYPGAYAIAENVDRIRDVILRAGDAVPGAYPESFHLVRDGRDVAVDYRRAMAGDPNHNLRLLDGDRVQIDRDPNTVAINGAVIRPALVKYRAGLSLQDYIELAGGATDNGDAMKAVVQHPSGIARRVRKVAYFFHTSPDVVSGSTIVVPERAPRNTTATEVLQRAFTAATALASLVLAYAAVTK